MTKTPKPHSEPLSIYVRAYVPPVPDDTREKQATNVSYAALTAKDRAVSNWVLVLDTETTTSAGQALRFGVYQLRNERELVEKGIFYASNLQAPEIALLERYACENGLKCMPLAQFIEEVFFGCAYAWRAAIVGFNLPYDLARLAIDHDSARGSMKGGYTFRYSDKPWHPRIQIKHLSRTAALIQFTKPFIGKETKRERRSGQKRPPKRGSFIDLKTAGAALLSRSFDLGSLTAFLRVETRKTSTDEHGLALSWEYLDYAVTDVQATWECYEVLLDRFGEHELTNTHLGKILSEASLGKAYLRQMGIRPLLELQPDIPAELVGFTMSSYNGGRAEVRWRREVTQVAYCDFLSMYPTVCTLMNLWRFVIAKQLRWSTDLDGVKSLLDRVTSEWLQCPENWRKLTALVKVRPSESLLPIRAKYGESSSSTIGLNYLTAADELWYTLPDLIVCKLLTGHYPEILDAITFEPGEPQEGLQSIRIAGRTEYEINPYEDDFFKCLIDLRADTKRRMRNAHGAEYEALDAEQLALKILANSTAYGIYVEVIVSDLDRQEIRNCHGPAQKAVIVETRKEEDPGKYFHPLLATLITGAARLMLGLCEHEVTDSGLDWTFCDTDSMAIARPPDMEEPVFSNKVSAVRAFFEAMNPYEEKGSLLKLEEANDPISQSGWSPLDALCISAKRYVLFNIDDLGRPVIRKASAHGLGHLLPPYEDDDRAPGIPEPAVSLKKIGVRRWQYDLWYQIITAHLKGDPDSVDLNYHPALNNPAAGRYSASSPQLLRWFRSYNQNRCYADQVKPFGFMVVFQARETEVLEEHFGPRRRGRPPKKRSVHPIAPFDRDPLKAALNAFDRETGKPVPLDQLKTYREILQGYHLSPESKFLNGSYFDRGRTERRHVLASEIRLIGKESNRWEEAMFLNLPDEEILYRLAQAASKKAAE